MFTVCFKGCCKIVHLAYACMSICTVGQTLKLRSKKSVSESVYFGFLAGLIPKLSQSLVFQVGPMSPLTKGGIAACIAACCGLLIGRENRVTLIPGENLQSH